MSLCVGCQLVVFMGEAGKTRVLPHDAICSREFRNESVLILTIMAGISVFEKKGRLLADGGHK